MAAGKRKVHYAPGFAWRRQEARCGLRPVPKKYLTGYAAKVTCERCKAKMAHLPTHVV